MRAYQSIWMSYSPHPLSHWSGSTSYPIESTSARDVWLVEVQVSIFLFGSSLTAVSLRQPSINRKWYQLSPKIGVRKGQSISQCVSAHSIIVHLTGPVMNSWMSLAWMQTAQMEQACVYQPIIKFMAVRFIWAMGWCITVNPQMVRKFWVVVVFSSIGVLDDFIIDLVIGEPSVIVNFPFSGVDDRSAVVWKMVYMPLTSFAVVLKADGEVVEYFCSKIYVCLTKYNCVIDRRQSWKVGAWRASTW